MIDNILWNSIRKFQLDDPNAEFTFSERLARDNNWTNQYALDVITEYKKFIYLCCISKNQITPSDSVDQAWHLHLTYTDSYWNKLCKKTIEKEIHHNPTKGGNKERSKYINCYDLTFESYKNEFGHEPPNHIWIDNKTRFEEINYKRINLNKYWLIPRPSRHIRTSILLSILSILIFTLFIRSSDSSISIAMFVIIILVILYNYFFGNNRKGGGCTVPYQIGVVSYIIKSQEITNNRTN